MQAGGVARTRSRRATRLLAVALLAGLLAACVVETPGIENTAGGGAQAAPTAAAPQPTAAQPQFEPTVAAEPTPTQVPPTPIPEPTATPVPAGPPPLPTTSPEEEFEPIQTEPGLIVVPVRGARFMLAESHPILQLGGHTLIYVDDERNAEVDIFTPVAAADLSAISSYATLITYLETNPVFAELGELSPVSIAGFPTRVFEGTASSPDRAFVTELAAADNEVLGWFPPARMRLWVIDHPDGPVIVSAESLENPGRYSDAVRLATEILSTIDFG